MHQEYILDCWDGEEMLIYENILESEAHLIGNEYQ